MGIETYRYQKFVVLALTLVKCLIFLHSMSCEFINNIMS